MSIIFCSFDIIELGMASWVCSVPVVNRDQVMLSLTRVTQSAHWLCNTGEQLWTSFISTSWTDNHVMDIEREGERKQEGFKFFIFLYYLLFMLGEICKHLLLPCGAPSPYFHDDKRNVKHFADVTFIRFKKGLFSPKPFSFIIVLKVKIPTWKIMRCPHAASGGTPPPPSWVYSLS